MVLSLASHCALAQNDSLRIIQAKVLDSFNGKPLLWATVRTNTSRATISNIDGEFSILCGQKDSVIRVSYVGYRDFEFKLKDGVKSYVCNLKPFVEKLDAAVVLSLDLDKLIKKLEKKYSKEHRKSKDFYRLFYRQITSVENEVIELTESFLSARTKIYLDNVNFSSGRYAYKSEIPGDHKFTFIDFIGLLNISPLTKENDYNDILSPLSLNYENYYDVSVMGLEGENGKIIYILSFKPKSGISKVIAAVEADVYIDADSLNILRFVSRSKRDVSTSYYEGNNLIMEKHNAEMSFSMIYSRENPSCVESINVLCDYNSEKFGAIQVRSTLYSMFKTETSKAGLNLYGINLLDSIISYGYKSSEWENRKDDIIKLTPAESDAINFLESENHFGTY